MKENNVKIHFSSIRIQQGKIHSVFSEVEEKLKFIKNLVAANNMLFLNIYNL